MSRFEFLTDLVEDTRHGMMRLRRYVRKEDRESLIASPNKLITLAVRAQEAEPMTAQDNADIELAAFLMSQYEEAVTRLTSMIPD